MKTINNIYRKIFGLISILFIVSACDNDGDKIYLSSIEGSDFIVTETNIVLTKDNSTSHVLSLAWTKDSFLAVSDPNMSSAVTISYYIQISNTPEFTSNVLEESVTDYSKAYTGAELNIIAKNLGNTPYVSTPVYFRIKSVTGPNMDGPYSKVCTVDITSYEVDMSVAFILDKDKKQTDKLLISEDVNGVYSGFMSAAAWSNYYLMEADGTIWGNDGVSGTAFQLSSDNDDTKRWNFWFPGLTGCYFSEVNTTQKVWSALYLPTLTASGDIQADMSFDRSGVRWITTFTAATASTMTIKLNSSNAKLYDYTTGTTDDNAAKNTTFAFAQSGDNIVKADQAGDISIVVPAAGTYTLVVNLSTAGAWTCSVVSGSEDVDEIIKYLYLPGIDDGISGSWTFDNYLRIYDEDQFKYAGVFNINSLYGYTMNIEKDNWDDKYTMVEGTSTAYAGTIEYKGTANITPPTAGLHLIEASTLDFTYTVTAITNKIYVLGLNDVWDFNTPLTATTTTGVYEGNITITTPSTYGFVISLVSGDWDRKFGGSSGKLIYSGNNITDDASLAAGTYKMQVDLINQTYTITQ